MYRRYLIETTGAAPEAAETRLSPAGREKLSALLADNEQHYRRADDDVTAMAARGSVSGADLSTMLNVDREIHHAVKNLLLALEPQEPTDL